MFLASGWRSYRDISIEMEWTYHDIPRKGDKTARRNVGYLEQAGYPIEFRYEPDNRRYTSSIDPQRVRLMPDWVSRCKWIPNYKEIVNGEE